jgi:hypothetical protein
MYFLGPNFQGAFGIYECMHYGKLVYIKELIKSYLF